MTSPTHRAGADVPVAYARVHDAAHPSYYDVVLPDSQEAEMWAYDLLPLYSGATIAALQARIAELEARNAASERDAAKWRNHVESSDASHTHRCRRCGWNYSPVAGTSEDCPACGFDGVGDAHAQGQAGEGKDG